MTVIDPQIRRNDADRIEERWVSIVIPALVACIMIGLLLSERSGVQWELRLTAPLGVPLGGAIPMRADVLRGMERPEGPVRVNVPVHVRLLDDEEHEVKRMTLAASSHLGAEGVMIAPHTRGIYTIEASTSESQGSRLLRRLIEVGQSKNYSPRPRHHLQAGSLTTSIEQRVGHVNLEDVEIRVEGGLCIAEVLCRVWVYSGETPSRFHFVPGPTVEVIKQLPEAVVSHDLVFGEVIIHGPEPFVDLIVQQNDHQEAAMQVQIPSGHGGLRLNVTPRIARSDRTVDIQIEDFNRNQSIAIDVFRDEEWVDAKSIAADHVHQITKFQLPNKEGIYRLVARYDFAADESNASIMVVVGKGTKWLSTQSILWSRDISRAIAFAYAPDEALVVAVPPWTSAIEQMHAGVIQKQSWRRYLAAIVICFCGLIVAYVIRKRILKASLQARELLAAAGDETAYDVNRLRKDNWMALGLSVFVFLAFIFAVVLILSRALI